MQNNEFEKQVQERMGQIKFTPSAAVWAEVEKNLKQRRKRRIAILWFFIFFIAAGGTSLGWLYLSPGNADIANHNISSSNKNNTTQTPSAVNVPDQSHSSLPKDVDKKLNDLKENAPTENITVGEAKQASGKNSGLSQKKNAPEILAPKQKSKSLSKSSYFLVETSGSKEIKKRDKKKTSGNLEASESIIASNQHRDHLTTVNDQTSQGETVKEVTVEPDSYETQKDSTVSLVKNTMLDSVAPSPSTVKINTTAKPKWQFGVSVGFGMSDVVNTLSADKSLAANPPSGNLSAPGVSFQNPALYISPTELNAGKNFSFGFAASRKIKKRLSLGVGLQYHYYSTSISVGANLITLSNSSNPADRTNSFLAAGPRVNNFTNKYHYIELPVTMGFQLLKNKPLLFSTGMSLGRLVGADVLSYSNSQGLYVQDNSQVNKYQLNVLMGLSWTFGEKGRLPIQFGPNFSYGISNLSNKSVSGANHMYTFGAGAKISFRKK